MKKSSCLNQERNLHRPNTVYKRKQFKTALNTYVCGFWCERQQEMDFSLEEVLLWTRILDRSEGLKLKCLNAFVSYKHTAFHFTWHSLMEWCGLLWCFYQLFGLSFWRHPFTAEHPWVSKWCNATFLQIWWWNKLSLHLEWLGEFIFSKCKFLGELLL